MQKNTRMSKPTILKHIDFFVKNGLISVKKVGNINVYTLYLTERDPESANVPTPRLDELDKKWGKSR